MADDTPTSTEARPSPPLDEVMLAMDVVDTLRAQRSLVETELDDKGRARAFADRVKAIYASQGIDVPDAVILEAVEALEQDRFTYKPPKRTFGVRLAEIYVDRGIWSRRLVAVLAVAALVWGGLAWSKARHNQDLEEAFATRQGLLGHEVETTGERIGILRRQIQEVARLSPEGGVVAGLTMQASALLGEVEGRYLALSAEAAPLDVEAYPGDSTRMDARLEARRRTVSEVQADLGRVEGQLDAIRRLQGLSGRITVALAQLAGLELTAAQQAELDRLRTSAETALEAGDADAAETYVGELRAAITRLVSAAETRRRVDAAFAAVAADLDAMEIEREAHAESTQLRGRVSAAIASGDLASAERHLSALRTLAEVLGTAYEFHIVSRPGEQSGIWRHPEDRPTARNYYILVEPIGPDGRPLSIPVRNEESQTTRMVTKLGIRVPEAVYEAVKQDKLDNGIVDRRIFGRKRRGRRTPEYDYEVVGGWITDW